MTRPKIIVCTIESMRSRVALLALRQGLGVVIDELPQPNVTGFENGDTVQPPDLDYCTVYRCAGDCGQPHNQAERTALGREYLERTLERKMFEQLTSLKRLPRNEPPPRYARQTGKQRAQWKTERNGRK